MGIRVGFIQNLIRAKRDEGDAFMARVYVVDGWVCTGWLAGCSVERLHRPSAVLFPRLLGDVLQPRWVRGWSLPFWRRARPAKNGRSGTCPWALGACRPWVASCPALSFLPVSGLWSVVRRPFHVFAAAAGPGKTLRPLMQTSNRPRTYQPILLLPISNSIATLSALARGPSLR